LLRDSVLEKKLELLLSAAIKAIPLKVFVRWGAGKKTFFQKGVFPAKPFISSISHPPFREKRGMFCSLCSQNDRGLQLQLTNSAAFIAARGSVARNFAFSQNLSRSPNPPTSRRQVSKPTLFANFKVTLLQLLAEGTLHNNSPVCTYPHLSVLLCSLEGKSASPRCLQILSQRCFFHIALKSNCFWGDESLENVKKAYIQIKK